MARYAFRCDCGQVARPSKLRCIDCTAVIIGRAFYKHGVRDPESGESWGRYLDKLREVKPDIDEAGAMALLKGNL